MGRGLYIYHYPFVRMSSGLVVASRARVISKQKQEVESTRQESEIVAGGALMIIAKAAPWDVCHKSSIQRFDRWKSSETGISRNFGLIPQRLQFSDPKFDVLPYQARPPKCNGVKYLTDWECNVRAWQVGRLQEVVSNWGWRHQAHSQHLFTSSSVSLFVSLSYIPSLCRFPLFANVSMSCCVKTEACL